MEARKKIWLGLSFMVLITSCAHERNTSINKIETDSSFTSPVKTSQNYKKPVELSFLKNNGGKVLKDVLKPIGWSKDGKFAYLVEYADEACGCYSMSINIIDAKKNKQLWTTEYNDQGEKKDLSFYWSNKYDSLKNVLNEYGIIQEDKKMELAPNIFEFDGHQYAISTRSTSSKEPDYGVDIIDDAEIFIKSSQKEIKVADCPISKPSRIMSVLSCGFVRSPYDNLIAILYNCERIGYEGPPHVVTVNIVGFDLSKL